jgi:hypothetical protein
MPTVTVLMTALMATTLQPTAATQRTFKPRPQM